MIRRFIISKCQDYMTCSVTREAGHACLRESEESPKGSCRAPHIVLHGLHARCGLQIDACIQQEKDELRIACGRIADQLWHVEGSLRELSFIAVTLYCRRHNCLISSRIYLWQRGSERVRTYLQYRSILLYPLALQDATHLPLHHLLLLNPPRLH